MTRETHCGVGPAPRATKPANSRISSDDKGESQEAGDQEGELRPLLTALTHRQARHAAREGRGEQAAGLGGGIAQIEQLAARTGRPRCS